MTCKYDKYKNSGIEWIGEVPEHWKVKRLKNITKLIYGETLSAEDRVFGEYAVYGSNGVTDYHDICITSAPCIVVGRKGSFGKLNYSERKCFPIDTTYYIDNTATKSNLKWLFYILQCLKLDKYSKDTGVPGLNREDAYRSQMVIPPLTEQTAIAKYLDVQTAKIDKLITNKENQIERLKEFREIEIHNAVTKGLNPNAPMKDSGIEWIGEVPEHWEVKRIKYLGKIVNGFAFNSSEFSTHGVRVMKISNIQTMKIDWSDESFIDPLYYKLYDQFRIVSGDIVFALTRPIISTGIKAAIVNFEEKVLLNQRNAVLKPNKSLFKKWIYFVILDYKFTQTFDREIDKTGLQPNISTISVGNIKIPLPSLSEQKIISKYLTEQTEKINKLLANKKSQIEKLKEYRKITIYNAVTGKIRAPQLCQNQTKKNLKNTSAIN